MQIILNMAAVLLTWLCGYLTGIGESIMAVVALFASGVMVAMCESLK